MNADNKFPNRYIHWFLFLISCQIIIWSLLPIFVVKGTYIDVLENLEWGRHWQWGYDKNPFFGALVTYWGFRLTHALSSAYFLSQIAVITSLWAIWRLAKQILPPIYALLSVTLLIAIKYYNIDTTEFNDDVLELALWSLTLYSFFLATKNQQIIHWLLTGFFAALALMTKYYPVMLLLAMLSFLLINQQARISFSKPGLYFALAIFLLICIPNFIWLAQHSFVSINYAFDRANLSQNTLSSFSLRIKNSFGFILNIILDILPLIIISLLCFRKREKAAIQLNQFTQQYLIIMGFGPIVFTLIFIILTGADFRNSWATPLFSLMGIIFISWLRPVLTRKNLVNYFITISSLFIFWCVFYIYYETIYAYHGNGTYEAFPNQKVATVLTDEWHQRYHTPLYYAAGYREYVLSLAIFSPDHPQGFFEWNPNHSQWINQNDLKQKGAVFLWDANDPSTWDANILQNYPSVELQPIHYFDWNGNDWFVNIFHLKHIKPVAMGVAFLPPEIYN